MNGDASLIRDYLGQPELLPRALARGIEKLFGGEPIQLYALADLDPGFRLGEGAWLALGPEALAVCLPGQEPRLLPRARLASIDERRGASATTLVLRSREGDALAVLRYTHRQRRAMSGIVFVLEQQLAGHRLALDPARADVHYADALSGPIRDAQSMNARGSRAVLLRLLAYLKPYRARLSLGLAAAAATAVAGLVPARLAGYVVDRVVVPFQSGALPSREASRLAWLSVAGMAAALGLRELFAWVRMRTLAITGEHVAADLRRDVFEHLQTLSLAFFSSKKTGSLISRITSDSDRIWEFIAQGLVEVTVSGLTLVGVGAMLLSLDWKLGLVMTVPVPLLFAAIWWHGRRMQGVFLTAFRKWSAVSDVLSDTLPGMKVVKAFHQESYESGKFNGANDRATREFCRVHEHWTTFWPLLMAATSALVVAVWTQAVPRLLGTVEPSGLGGGAPRLSAGTFVSFVFYMAMFGPPIETIGQMSRMLNRAMTSAYRLFELLDYRPSVVEPSRAAAPVLEGDVRFENVSFGYDGVRQVVRGVSFHARPGEMIGLVGPSGGGKTTLTNLLARFYDVTGGRVLVDGIDVRELDSGALRRQIGMVLQEAYLFHGTILDNIRYGKPEATPEAAIEAARAAFAHDFILKLPHGYETVVGERGHTLSGGERQRVSIARAILHDPRILILDEATSAVDTETERRIQEALDRLVKGRTVFAIAHRLSTLTRADRLIVVQDGRIAEEGTHAELLARPEGIYRKLHGLQLELQRSFI
jgi:ATP-binding cassette subfamily B protein